MKYLLFLFATVFSFEAKSQINQRLDTVFARNLVFTYDELNHIKGGWLPKDSLEKKFFKKMATAVNAVQNKLSGTNITIDSIPGAIAILWYSNFRSMSEGEAAGLTNNTKSKIKGYAPLTSTCQKIDDDWDAKRQNVSKNGKDDW